MATNPNPTLISLICTNKPPFRTGNRHTANECVSCSRTPVNSYMLNADGGRFADALISQTVISCMKCWRRDVGTRAPRLGSPSPAPADLPASDRRRRRRPRRGRDRGGGGPRRRRGGGLEADDDGVAVLPRPGRRAAAVARLPTVRRGATPVC